MAASAEKALKRQSNQKYPNTALVYHAGSPSMQNVVLFLGPYGSASLCSLLFVLHPWLIQIMQPIWPCRCLLLLALLMLPRTDPATQNGSVASSAPLGLLRLPHPQETPEFPGFKLVVRDLAIQTRAPGSSQRLRRSVHHSVVFPCPHGSRGAASSLILTPPK